MGEVSGNAQNQRLRRTYLDQLFAGLRQLPLSPIDPKAATRGAQLQLDGVYTAQLTTRSEQEDPRLRGNGTCGGYPRWRSWIVIPASYC